MLILKMLKDMFNFIYYQPCHQSQEMPFIYAYFYSCKCVLDLEHGQETSHSFSSSLRGCTNICSAKHTHCFASSIHWTPWGKNLSLLYNRKWHILWIQYYHIYFKHSKNIPTNNLCNKPTTNSEVNSSFSCSTKINMGHAKSHSVVKGHFSSSNGHKATSDLKQHWEITGEHRSKSKASIQPWQFTLEVVLSLKQILLHTWCTPLRPFETNYSK